ncbi:MAG: type IV toxin-antitoxin system AbiEi family antitoxin domain-containing protein [Nocardioides sp.]
MDAVLRRLASLPEAFTTQDACEVGLSRHVLARLLRTEQVTKLQRGLYRRCTPNANEQLRWELIKHDHRVRAAAALRAHPGHALSHVTNAVARGWPVNLHPESLVHLTAITVQPRSRRVADRFLHHSDSVINDLELIGGMPALTASRTVADCLRTMKLPAGVAVADAALRLDATRREVEEVLTSQHRWVGRPRAVTALALVDPRRESWLESFSFVRLWERGIELPTPQVEVYDEFDRFVARVDGMWIADGTVAEADGTGKYLIPTSGSTEPTARSAAERVISERHRERAVLDLGLEVARWDNHEIQHQLDDVVRRVQRTRLTGSIRRFRGHLRVEGRVIDLTEHR